MRAKTALQSLSEATFLEEVVELSEEVDEFVKIRRAEDDKKVRLLMAMSELVGLLGRPVPLSAQKLGSRPRLKSALLDEACVVTMTDNRKKLITKPLGLFDSATFLNIVQEAVQAIQTMVKEARDAYLERIKPRLSVTPTLKGGHLGIFDWRSYHLLISNSNRAAKKLIVIANPKGKVERWGPVDLQTGANADVDLGAFKALSNSGRLRFDFLCEDEYGHNYAGEARVTLGKNERKEILLEYLPTE